MTADEVRELGTVALKMARDRRRGGRAMMARLSLRTVRGIDRRAGRGGDTPRPRSQPVMKGDRACQNS
jgi:hypothetical protein